MSTNPIFDYEEKPGFWKRYGLVVGLGVLVIVGGGAVYLVVSQSGKGGAKRPEMVTINALPPPPAVKPPPPPPPPKQDTLKVKEEMVEQTAVDESEQKPDDAPAADPGIGTGLTGPGGPDGFGLGKGKGNGGRGGGGKGGGSKFGWYAAQVQKRISEAIQQHPKVRVASGTVKVRIWADAAGRVTKAKLVEPSGDAASDALLCTEVLTGLLLKEPPPSDLPQPITLRVALRRPN